MAKYSGLHLKFGLLLLAGGIEELKKHVYNTNFEPTSILLIPILIF